MALVRRLSILTTPRSLSRTSSKMEPSVGSAEGTGSVDGEDKDSKYKKEKRYVEYESDLDENAVTEHEAKCKACKLETPEKEIGKENEKLVEKGKPAQDKDSVRS